MKKLALILIFALFLTPFTAQAQIQMPTKSSAKHYTTRSTYRAPAHYRAHNVWQAPTTTTRTWRPHSNTWRPQNNNWRQTTRSRWHPPTANWHAPSTNPWYR